MILTVGSHGCTSVIMAEARGLRDGVQAATMASYKDIIVEGDNQMIINALLGTISTPWKISNVIRDVRFLLQSSNNDKFQVQHIYREANMAADWLSKSGHIHPFVTTTPESLPRELQKIVWEDMTGRAFVRKAASSLTLIIYH